MTFSRCDFSFRESCITTCVCCRFIKMNPRPDRICISNRMLLFSDIISVYMSSQSWELSNKIQNLIYLKLDLKENFIIQSFSGDYLCLSESILNCAGRNLGQNEALFRICLMVQLKTAGTFNSCSCGAPNGSY